MQIETIPDEAWADVVADHWAARLRANPRLTMCLPTGATPRGVYTAMARRVSDGLVSFAEAEVFLIDEFMGLERGDPGRCDSMIEADLVSRVDLPASSSHGPDPDAADPQAEIESYRRRVHEASPQLVMLGVGRNGHLALNEPGASADSSARVVDLTEDTAAGTREYGARSLPTGGMTLGLEDLFAGDEVWLLVSGAHKAEVVNQFVTGPISSACPASFARDVPHARLFVDESAASLL